MALRTVQPMLESLSTRKEITMAYAKTRRGPAAGDVVEVSGHRLGERPRQGEILEVLRWPEHVHFRVRWEDGRESIFYPGADASVRPSRARTKR